MAVSKLIRKVFLSEALISIPEHMQKMRKIKPGNKVESGRMPFRIFLI